jgi:DNA-binding NtrC family response regulator
MMLSLENPNPFAVAKTSVNRALQPTNTNQVIVLAVSPIEGDHLSLQRICSHSSWKLHQARNYREALACLEKNQISVIISECDVPPYNWRVLLNHLADRDHPPRLIVTSWHADDHLWAEVLNMGGFDVLPKPFEPRELFRVVSLAWRTWKDACELPAKAMAAG